MCSAYQDKPLSKFNPKVRDPVTLMNRNTFNEQQSGLIMRPVQLSLVIGSKGTGVSTLLRNFGKRADAQDTLIVDEKGKNGVANPLPVAWNSDAITAWLKAIEEPYHASHIVLAASDLKAPRYLLQSLASDPDLGALYRLNATTYVINAAVAERSGTQDFERAAAVADRFILTHTDQAQTESVSQLARALKSLNPPAPILRARGGDIGPARLVDSGLFDPIDGSIDIDRWLCEAAFNFEATRRGGSAIRMNLPETTLSRLNVDAGVRFFAVTIDQPLDSNVLSVFLKLLMADRGADLLRLKGIVATEDHPDRPALIDGREHLIQPLLWLPTWPTADRRGRLVFVTADTSEDWVRTLLTTLSDQLKLQAIPELQTAMIGKMG